MSIYNGVNAFMPTCNPIKSVCFFDRQETVCPDGSFHQKITIIKFRVRGGGGILPYMGSMGTCGPKGLGFSAVLVINRVIDLSHFAAILITNRYQVINRVSNFWSVINRS